MGFNVFNTAYARVYRQANQTIPNNTETLVIWQTAEYAEPESMWRVGSPTKVFAPYDGLFEIKTNGAFAFNLTGTRYLHIRVNGESAAIQTISPITTGAGISVNTDLTLRAGDNVSVGAYQDSGGNLSLLWNLKFFPMLSLFGKTQP